MLKRFTYFGVLALIMAGIISCAKKQDESNLTQGLSQDIQQKILNLGFSPDNAFAVDGGVIVEGDIFLTAEDLEGNTHSNLPSLIIGETEQYNTFNLVTGLPRQIVVTTSGANITTGLSNAIDGAIARYNAETLGLTFVRGGSSGGGDINIKVVNTGQYIASSGFPTNGGDPYPTISYAKKYNNYGLGFMTTVIAHEMGHCIGFRHTDYMNRAYSCGTGGNEGQETNGVGAVHIPGTPNGPEAGSWMLACLSATTDRPFTNNDKTALDYLY